MPFSLFGSKPTDIELPNESGKVDKRLKAGPTPLETLRASFGTAKAIKGGGLDAIKGLKQGR